MRVPRNLVADDDQPQILISLVAFERTARDGEGFNEPRNVLLRPDGTGIEQERVANLVSLEDAMALAGGGVLDGERFLSAETLRRATEIQTTRPDIVVGFPMRWRLGYHVAATTRGIIPNGFGHFGFGGSGAWADPDNDLAVAFVCNRVAGTPFGDTRFLRIGAQARAAATAR